jgi:hypothetical protein
LAFIARFKVRLAGRAETIENRRDIWPAMISAALRQFGKVTIVMYSA